MKKLSFFSIPRNKTRKETLEVIKNSLIANGWKFVEKSERRLEDRWAVADTNEPIPMFKASGKL